jgi:hypothetical protein
LEWDTDGDGLSDGWEHHNGLDPIDPFGDNGADGDPDHDGLLNSEERDKGTKPKDADSDHDGISDGSEIDQGTLPNNPSSKPAAEWFVLTGTYPENVTKARSRSITIPKGQSRLVVVALASAEYPDYTEGSEFKDILTWNVTGGGLGLNGSPNVNSLHGDWITAELNGVTNLGFPVVYCKEYKLVHAPPDADVVISIALSATNIGDSGFLSTVMVGVLPVVIAKVEFSGEKYWELTTDKGAPAIGLGGMNYAAPHWQDADGDGKADNPDVGDHNYPVAFTRSSTPQIAAKLRIKGLGDLAPTISPQLKATGPGAIAIPATPLDSEPGAADSWLLLATAAGTLPATVKYYGAQESGKEFKLSWSLDLKNEGAWEPIHDTLHTVYVTFADPFVPGVTKHREETLFNLGCRNADGLANNADNALVNAIYAEFTDQKVNRVIPGSALREAEVLYYWKDYDENLPVGDLLSSVHRNGSCGDWAYLLSRAICVQGIKGQVVTIKSKAFANSEGLMIKTWHFVPPGTSGNNTYPFTIREDAVIMNSIPAQGHDATNPGDAQTTNQHMITISGEYLYDPSYGTARIEPSNGQADYKKYEDSTFDGYRWRDTTLEKSLGRINDVTPESSADVDTELLPIN